MRVIIAPLALGIVLALSACAQQPESRPVIGDLRFTPREILPGDSIDVSFRLTVKDPGAVKAVHIRGLPENTLSAGTEPRFRLPTAQITPYITRIPIRPPAMDGQFNLDLVIETGRRTYAVPLGSLAIRDTPSRILHAQFLPGSHTAKKCAPGVKTKLLKFEYTVTDDNGAADFAAPTLVANNAVAKSLIFFPHWEAVAWTGRKEGLVLDRPSATAAREQLVSSDIRVLCRMPQATLYEYVLKGQSVSRLTGEPTFTDSDPARYYVE